MYEITFIKTQKGSHRKPSESACITRGGGGGASESFISVSEEGMTDAAFVKSIIYKLNL